MPASRSSIEWFEPAPRRRRDDKRSIRENRRAVVIFATVCDTVRVGVLLELETGDAKDIWCRPEFTDESVVNRIKCRPFGVTWSEDELYVGNNRQLLVFDKNFSYVRTSDTPLQINTHQLCWNAGRVWVTSPWTNSLIGVSADPRHESLELDTIRHAVKPYAARNAEETDDVNHVNSLLWADGRLYVAAHNFDRPSFVLCYREEDFRFEEIVPDAGYSIHGLAHVDGELYWISTLTREIRSNRGYRLNLTRPGFARGFAVTAEYFIVALSEHRSRMARSLGDSHILVISRSTRRIVAEHTLRATGSLNDLRLLDQFDHAHGQQPFWPARRLSGVGAEPATPPGRAL